MNTLIFDLLDHSLHYDDWRGHFAKAQRETEIWLQKAEAGERPVALLWSAVLAYLQGKLLLAEARLTEAERAAPEDPATLLQVQTYRLLLTYERYNTFPGGGAAAAVEQSARWRGAPDLQGPDQRWRQLHQQAPNDAARWDAWYIYGFLCNLRVIRYMLDSTRYAPSSLDQQQILDNQLQTIEGIRQQAEKAGLSKLAAYVSWCGADLYFRLGDDTSGEDWLKRMQALAQQSEDPHSLGLLAMTRGDRLAAPFTSPLFWNFALQDSSSEGSHLSATVEAREGAAVSLDDLERAVDYYEKAKHFFEEAKSPRALAVLLLRRSYLATLRDFNEANILAVEAAGLFASSGDEKGVQLALLHQVMALLSLDYRDEGRDRAEAIGRWGKENGSFTYVLGLGIVLNRFARHQLLRRGNYEGALAAYRAAESLHRALGADIQVAQNIVDLGTVFSAVGDRDAALVQFAKGLDAYESAGRKYLKNLPGGEAIQANLLQRRTFLATNAYQLALQGAAPEAMAIFAARLNTTLAQFPGEASTDEIQWKQLLQGNTDLGDGAEFWSLRQMGRSVLEQASVLVPLYRSRKARREGHMKETEAAWSEAFDAVQQVVAPQRYFFEALLYSDKENYDRAAAAYRLYEQNQESGWLANLVQQMGDTAGELGREEVALQHRRRHQQSFSMWTRLKHYREAAQHLQSLQEMDGEKWWTHDDKPWQLLSNAGEVYEGLGEPSKAMEAYEQAFTALEKRRNQLSRDELKTAIAADKGAQYLYFLAARNAFKLKNYQQAFDYIERGKARSLLDLMAESATQLEATGEESQLLMRWRQTNAELALHRGLLATEHSRQQPDAGRLQQLEDQVEADEQKIHQLEKQLAGDHPQFYQAVSPEGKLLTIEEVAKALPERNWLVEYALLEEDLLIWVVNHQGLKGAFHYQLDVEDLEREIEQLLERVQRRRPVGKLLKSLSAKLVAPIAGLLPKAGQVTIVPYGSLHRLPFQALLLKEQPLVRSLEVSYLPSASLLQYVEKPEIPAAPTLLSVGNPTLDLANAAAEAAFVARLYQQPPLLEGEATEERVREQLGRAHLIHLATHGNADDQAPLRSAVALAAGERLTLYEMMGLRLKAQLVVLSACETAVGTTTGGDEVLGLTRGLLAAGARSAIVTLWNVDDLSTSLLMGAFYRSLQQGNSTPKALQSAQEYLRNLPADAVEKALNAMEITLSDTAGQALLQRQRSQRGIRLDTSERSTNGRYPFRHPFYWAPFVYVGK